MSARYLVYGVAIAGAAVVRALTQRGLDVEVADDAGTEAVRSIADELGVELIVAPEPEELAALVERCDVVVPAPGVPRRTRCSTSPVAPGVRCGASSSWPTAGSRSGQAVLGRCWR